MELDLDKKSSKGEGDRYPDREKIFVGHRSTAKTATNKDKKVGICRNTSEVIISDIRKEIGF